MFGDNPGINTDPEYWWNEAADMIRDADVLLRNGGTRKSVCNHCHGTIERSLKAVLAAQGKLRPDDTTHSLAKLAREAEILDSVPIQLRQYIIVSSSMHSVATYPEVERRDQIWYDDAKFKAYVMNTGWLYKLLLARYGNSKATREGNGIEHD